MIDIIAGFSLAGAAVHSENPVQLLNDAETLYGLYSKAKLGKLDFNAMAASGELKTVIQAAARITAVANTLVDDPAQFKNITELLASL